MTAHLATSMLGGAALLATCGAQADPAIAVPSGQPLTLLEVLQDPRGVDGLTARFRFLAPAIGQPELGIDVDDALADMDALCDVYVLSRVATRTGPMPVQIVISLSDRPVPFGVDDPEATQYFESYDIADGTCVPALF